MSEPQTDPMIVECLLRGDEPEDALRSLSTPGFADPIAEFMLGQCADVQPPAGMKERILDAISDGEDEPAAGLRVLPDPELSPSVLGEPRCCHGRPQRRWRYSPGSW